MFRYDPEYEENERQYAEIRRDILGDDEDEDEEKKEDGGAGGEGEEGGMVAGGAGQIMNEGELANFLA